jgi:hypothetical protein
MGSHTGSRMLPTAVVRAVVATGFAAAEAGDGDSGSVLEDSRVAAGVAVHSLETTGAAVLASK